MQISADMKLVDQQKMSRTIHKVIELLVKGEYDALIEFCHVICYRLKI